MSQQANARGPILFLATPLHDGRVHRAYMNGALQLAAAIPGRLIISSFTSQSVFVSRDVLTAHFLRSNATHLLFVDSDMGWTAADAEKLVLAGKDFVAGTYARKQADRALASTLLDDRDGELVEAEFAAAGFLLMSRAGVERMVGAHPELEYATAHGPAFALWSPIFDGIPYGEDFSFSKRWRALGGKIWVHRGVRLGHFGESIFWPTEGEP